MQNRPGRKKHPAPGCFLSELLDRLRASHLHETGLQTTRRILLDELHLRRGVESFLNGGKVGGCFADLSARDELLVLFHDARDGAHLRDIARAAAFGLTERLAR